MHAWVTRRGSTPFLPHLHAGRAPLSCRPGVGRRRPHHPGAGRAATYTPAAGLQLTLALVELARWCQARNDDVVEMGPWQERDTEAALVARCRAGDPAAFDTLVTAYSSMVYNVAYRQLGDREEALDLSQEVFLRVYRKLDSFRGESTFKTWVFRIVVNLAKNRQKWWKARRKDRTVSLDAPASPADDEGTGPTAADRLADGRPDPEAVARNRDLEARVLSGMEKLSSEHRQILVLRDIEDLSYEEIAQALELSEGTVKSRISRARLQLREVLGGRL